MRKLITLAAILIAVGAPVPGAAQFSIEARGDLGFNQVDPPDWQGVGAFDANRLVWGGDVVAVLGRPGPQALQVAIEVGYQRLMSYKRIVAGQPTTQTESGVRLFGGTRFWINDGAFYGELGAGIVYNDGSRHPVVGAGFAKHFEIGERLSVPLRARTIVIFDPQAFVVPFFLQAGIAYRLGEG